jgi:hypothetical protein
MEEEFLLDVVSQVFGSESNRSFERTFARLRFRKDFNGDLEEIGQQLEKENSAWVYSNWSEFQTRKIMKPLLEAYGAEIQQDYRDVDGFDFALWENPGRGRFSPANAAFKWLWDCKYPRWIWSRLVNQAWPGSQEIEMRKVMDPRAPDTSDLPKIDKGKEYQCSLKFKMPGHLLLLGKDSREVYCLCPSPGFAPDTQLSDTGSMVLPQPGSRLAANGDYLSFSNLGTEAFLAVVTPESLGLSWAKSGGEDDYFTLTADSLVELYKTIDEQDSHLFYRAFEVVNSR